ncbi:MAG TPA: hypothetical protein VGO58_03385 [Chitinophagaceae bacterium]|jgi:hypothetical protein|nr:hypothetical protein [Chitinophagaceae bacterium]
MFSPWLTNAAGVGVVMATIYNFEELEIWKLAFTIYKKVSAIAERMRAKHELKSQLHQCLSDRYISQDEFRQLHEETDLKTRKISSFIIYLNKSKTKGLKFKDRYKP